MASFGPYPAVVLSIHDGDTITLQIDLGFLTFTQHPCRIVTAEGLGIDAPELRTVAGNLALAYAQTLVKPGDKVTTLSRGWDAYNPRYLGSIRLADGRDFATEMLNAGHAVRKDFK